MAVLFNLDLIIVPVSLGRSLFNCILAVPIAHGNKTNDLYAFTIGVYVIWTSLPGTWHIIEQVKMSKSPDFGELTVEVVHYCLQVLALLSIWVCYKKFACCLSFW